MQLGVEYKGLDEYAAMLRGLPARVRRPILERAAQVTQNIIRINLNRSTATWRNKPTFDVKSRVTDTSLSVTADTDSDIYRYVDEGTRPHTIEPRGSGYPLRFQTGYSAKTRPNVLSSSAGGASGPYVRAWSVRHPGTTPRRISQGVMRAALDALRSTLNTLWEKAVRQAVRR